MSLAYDSKIGYEAIPLKSAMNLLHAFAESRPTYLVEHGIPEQITRKRVLSRRYPNQSPVIVTFSNSLAVTGDDSAVKWHVK